MGKTLRLIGVLLIVAVPMAWTAVRAADPPATTDTVVKMEEVSAFDAKEVGPASMTFFAGPAYMCSTTPRPGIKAYPKLNSSKPLYGTLSVTGGSGASPGAANRYDFVLDQSEPEAPAADAAKQPAGEKPATEESKEKAKTSATVQRIAAAVLPATERRVQSPPVPKYDLLYFDANRDGDLTNDPPVKLMKDPPQGIPISPNLAVFDAISVEVPLGGDAAPAKVRLLPMLTVYSFMRSLSVETIPSGAKAEAQPTLQAYVRFAPATLRKGTLRIGEKEYEAILWPAGIGRYDEPMSTRLLLVPREEIGKPRSRTVTDSLAAFRQFDGQLYQFRATPTGDELRFGPYRGDLGVLEVGPGGRAITELGVIGGLQSRDTFVPLGEPTPVAPKEFPRRYMVPVGDYQPVSLTIQYGRLRFNYRGLTPYDLGQAPGQPPKQPAYPVQIRKDKPVVLEFSGKPGVKFLDPAEGRSSKPGDTVMIRAMLTEMDQGIAITGLFDTSQKQGEIRYSVGGKTVTAPNYARLDPNIVIRNSKGEQVAQGRMPFG